MNNKKSRDIAWAIACHIYDYVGKHPNLAREDLNELFRKFYAIGRHS